MPLKQLDSTAAHLRHGVKTGLACTLSYATTLLFDLPYGFWAVITSTIVMQFHIADSIRMGWYRFTGTVIGAAAGLGTLYAFSGPPPLVALGLFLSIGLCAYLTRYNERFRMAAITVAIVFLTGFGQEDRLLYTLNRVFEIGIGVIWAVAVSVLVWPVRASQALAERLRAQYERAADKYEHIVEAFLSRQSKADPNLLDGLDQDASRNRGLLIKILSHERLVMATADANRLSLQVGLLNRVLEKLHTLLSLLNDVDEEGQEIIMAPEISQLAKATAQTLRSIGQGNPTGLTPLIRADAQADNRFQELRTQGVTRRFRVRKMMQVLSFLNSIQLLATDTLTSAKSLS